MSQKVDTSSSKANEPFAMHQLAAGEVTLWVIRDRMKPSISSPL